MKYADINLILRKYLKYFVLALLIYMPVFGFLDTFPIRIWDEARIAINAHEMFKNGDFIVTYYDGLTDVWNTKPPLIIWLQVFLMHTIGVNEIAIRLPTAFAAFLTCVALLVFSLRYLKNFWLGFIAILLLITSEGYVTTHVARTGDYDTLLTFFTTSAALFFFAFCETKKNNYLYLFFVSITLAVLTKGVAGLLFLPAFAIYCILQKQLKFFLTNKHFYIGIISFLFIALGYYFLREMKSPGYIATVQENELGGRYLNSQGDQKYNFWFYLDNFMTYRLADRYLLIPCGLLIGLVSKHNRVRKFTFFVLLVVVTFFIIISSGKTKMEWYDAPLYPFLCILMALSLYYVFELLRNAKRINHTLTFNIIPFLFLFLIFLTPYKTIWARTFRPEEFSWNMEFYEIGYFLKDAVKGKYDLNNKLLIYDGYNAQNTFYTRILNDKGVKTKFIDWHLIKKGDVVITFQENLKQFVRNNYLYKEENIRGQINTFTITGY